VNAVLASELADWNPRIILSNDSDDLRFREAALADLLDCPFGRKSTVIPGSGFRAYPTAATSK
jgi:hypothetical protein